jgi:hypothetical protein
MIILSLVCVAAPSVSAASNMQFSAQGVNFIKSSEGFAEYPYFDNGQWAGFELYDPLSEHVLWIHMWEDWLVVQTYSPRTTQYYKVPGGIDWAWLNTMLGAAEE